MSDPPTSCFPDIDEQWLVNSVREDASPEGIAFRLLLEGYMKPLAAYLRASSLREFGDPDEIAMDFLLSMLGDPREFRESMERWAASGVPLCRWMVSGLCLHVSAGMKKRSREPLPTSDLLAEPDEALLVERKWESAVAREIIEVCCQETRVSLIEEGRDREWDMFTRHVIDGIPCSALAIQSGVSENEVRTIVRRITALVRARLRRKLSDLNDLSADDLA